MRLWAFQGNDKMYRRAIVMERRIEKLNTVERPNRERNLTASFGEWEFAGDEVFSLRDLSMGFEGRTLFSNVNLKVRGGERIALIGDNGTGKSTFLKLLWDRNSLWADVSRPALPSRRRTFPQIVSFPTVNAIWWTP